MINIKKNLLKKTLLNITCFLYIIIGKEFLISEEIKNSILKYFNKKKYFYKKNINITSNNDWKKVIYEYQQSNIFDEKKILLLTIKDNTLNYNTILNLHKIFQYNNKNILLIINFFKLIPNHNVITLLKKNFLEINIIIISVKEFNQKNIKEWITKKIKKINLYLHPQSIYKLSYFYERNLLILSKFLNILKMISITHNPLKDTYIESITEDSVHFNMIHFLHALFFNYKIRAIRILNYFKKNKYDILYIIRILQKSLFFIINIKKNLSYNNISKYYISKEYYQMLKKSNYKINLIKLNNIINILTKIEINIKKNKNEFIWLYLKQIIMIF